MADGQGDGCCCWQEMRQEQSGAALPWRSNGDSKYLLPPSPPSDEVCTLQTGSNLMMSLRKFSSSPTEHNSFLVAPPPHLTTEGRTAQSVLPMAHHQWGRGGGVVLITWKPFWTIKHIDERPTGCTCCKGHDLKAIPATEMM